MVGQTDFMQLLQGARIGAWQMDIPSRTVVRNPAWTELLACTEEDNRDDPIGGWMRRVHADDVGTLLASRDSLMRGDIDEYWCEYRLKRDAGSWIHVRGHVQCFERDAQGAALRIGGIAFDISREREQAEARYMTEVVRMRAELLQANERLQTATACAEIGLWDFNPCTNQLWFSTEAFAMLDLPTGRESLDAQHFIDLFHPDDRSHAVQIMDDLLHGVSTELRHEVRMRNRQGQWRWMLHRGRIAERDAQGAPLRVVGVQMDVTERHAMEAQLAAAQRLEALGQLAAGVSHEINTPVQYVNDSVYFVRDAMQDLMRCLESLQGGRALSPDDQENLLFMRENLPLALTRAMDGLGRVSEIVRSMKEFAHPDRHEMAPVDINQSIQSTLIVARNEYKHVARIELELGALPPVQCHGGEINQVLLNLIVNAAHAIASVVGDSGKFGVIRIATRAEGGEVIIAVSDSGCGIPSGIQHRVFEPFFTTKGVGRGTGQGLAIAHQLIVVRHGGRISFVSEPATGTTFHIGIPIAGRVLQGAVAA